MGILEYRKEMEPIIMDDLKNNRKNVISRWLGGVQAITPLQMVKINLWSYLLVFVGIILGLITTWGKTWWLFLVLLGSLLISGLTYLSLIQKYKLLSNIQKELKGGLNA